MLRLRFGLKHAFIHAKCPLLLYNFNQGSYASTNFSKAPKYKEIFISSDNYRLSLPTATSPRVWAVAGKGYVDTVKAPIESDIP
jgi:hypothetical protein